MRTVRLWMALFFLMTVLIPMTALAENDPRDSICLPGGTSLFLFYYRQYSGDEMYAGGDKTADNLDYTLNMGIFRYAHFVGFGDWTWSYDVVLPVGDLDVNSNHSSGLGDATLATHINTPFFYRTDKMNYMMSAGFYLGAPTGEYDSDKSANLGANRWSYKFEFTPLILQVDNFALEFTADAKFCTDNDEYGASSANLETDPLFSLQTHASYNITDTFWVGLSHYYYTGGENQVDNVNQNDKTKNQDIRFSVGFNLAPNVVLLLQYDTEIERENGLKQNYIGTRIAYAW